MPTFELLLSRTAPSGRDKWTMSAYVAGENGTARPIVYTDETEFYDRIVRAGLNDEPNPRRLLAAGHALTMRTDKQTLVDLGVWEPLP
jgi:hypothetical protein